MSEEGEILYHGYKEDDLTEKIIEYYKEEGKRGNKEIRNLEPEAHYNDYGKRGIADLYIVFIESNGNSYGEVSEVKARLDNANEIVRQLNKMWKFFFKDEIREKQDKVLYRLYVFPTRENYEHIVKYKNIYQTLKGKNFSIVFSSPRVWDHSAGRKVLSVFDVDHEVESDAYLRELSQIFSEFDLKKA